MHLLWIAIALTLLKGNCGEDEAPIDQNLLNELFNLNTTFENKAGGTSTSESSNGIKSETNVSRLCESPFEFDYWSKEFM